jgi:hypothetical protein
MKSAHYKQESPEKMDLRSLVERIVWRAIPMFFAGLMLQGCPHQWGTAIQRDSASQILMSDSSQVKLRSIQSRVFDTTDKLEIMGAAVAAMQDLYFDIDVLDEDLGVVSGKKVFHEDGEWVADPTYYLYTTDELIIFNTKFRTWGPFNYRHDLTRMTITVRSKEETRSLVRVSVQYALRAVEDPEMYQKFFKTLEQSLFLSGQMNETP